jgi:phosphatidate phosphatase APP1
MVLAMKKSLGLLSPPVILAYRGFGNQQQVLVAGHVLDDRLLYEATTEDRTRKNMRAMLSRYWSTSIPNVRVAIELLGYRSVVTTDENGLFEKVFRFSEPLSVDGWQSVRYQVLDELEEGQDLLVSEGEVYIQSERDTLGIISDVDDTILISHATETLKKLRLILTKNPKTRLPFAGVSAFYQALQAGASGQLRRPIFYVSSSAWNLYDFLVDFCEVRGIPKGPFLLQDLKTNLLQLYRSGGGSHHHKLEKIRSLLQLYPNMSFILIGDSGQKDPILYAEAVKAFPGRIRAIYIRDLSIPQKAAAVSHISETLTGQDVEMILVKDTAEAAEHAFANGWITKTALEEVIRETQREAEQPLSILG